MDNKERDERILSLTPLVQHLAAQLVRSRNLPNDLRDDLAQYGSIGAIKAVDDFDPKHGASLRTYAATRILGHMLDGLRKESGVRRIAGEVRRTQPETTALDADRHDMADASDPYRDVDISETLRATLDRMPPGSRQILLDHYVFGITMDDISVLHGVSPSRISQMMSRALDDARQVANDPDAVVPERPSTQRHIRVSPNLGRKL